MEQAGCGGQTDGRTDGRTDGQGGDGVEGSCRGAVLLYYVHLGVDDYDDDDDGKGAICSPFAPLPLPPFQTGN